MPFTVTGTKHMYHTGTARVNIEISDEQVYMWYEELQAAKLNKAEMLCSECSAVAADDDYLCWPCRKQFDTVRDIESDEHSWEVMRRAAMQAGYDQAMIGFNLNG